jgi:hypothetical protein
MIRQHVQTLQNNISNLLIHKNSNNLTIPTCFEYYSAIFLTNTFNTPFNVWKDVPKDEKKKYNFPVRDKGIDLINKDFSIIAQSKYYIKSTLTYGKLSTFLATDKIVDKTNFQMALVRLSNSKIDNHIKHMISKGILLDFQIDNKDFIDFIHQTKYKL